MSGSVCFVFSDVGVWKSEMNISGDKHITLKNF